MSRPMLDHIRPLVASRFRIATDLPVPGRYDSKCQLRLDERGWPLAAIGPIGETSPR